MGLPVSFYGETIADETLKGNGQPETASWQVPVTTLTAANYVAKKVLIDNLNGAVQAIRLGNLLTTDVTMERLDVDFGPDSNPLAQRENKYLIRYHDGTTHKPFRVSIPCADLSVKMANSEFIDTATGVGAALKTAFEAIVVSPDDSSHAVVLDSIQFVGRNT